MKRKPVLIYAVAIITIAVGIWFIAGSERLWRNQPLHSTMEAVEALAALLMAIFLLGKRDEEGEHLHGPLALGFLGMGILNTAHASLPPGNQFVFFRAFASLVGGLGFALVWLPARFRTALGRAWSAWAVVSGSLVVCVWTLLFPGALPPMLDQRGFTTVAVIFNLIAGMLFMAGTLRFIIAVRRSDRTEDFLLSLIGLFFGLSSLTFQFSAPWAESWWFWHLLRLIGALLVLGLLIRRHLQTVSTLKTSLGDLTKTENSVRRSYSLTKTILDSMNDAVSLIDVRDFTIVRVNSTFLRVYGYSNESEVVGKTCYEITHDRSSPCGPPDDICPLIEAVRTGKHLTVDHVHYDRQGEKIYAEVSASPIKDENGKVVQVVHVSRDVTDRKRGEKERERLLADIARSNKDLEQFAYVASHDLQEPLRMVAGYVQLLEKKYRERLDDKADTYIHFAVDGVHRMQKLIEGLLAYSRVSRRDAEFGSVDTDKIFFSAVSNLASSIGESNAVVTKEDLPVVLGDETQLLQLFQNLIGNAIKYRKPGRSPQVHVSSTQEGDHYIVSVRDNGIGIDANDYERIFQIFQRLHTRQEYSGAGIGLAVCKRIVERHSGRIWVTSVPGEGSTFFFTLSVCKAETKPARALKAA